MRQNRTIHFLLISAFALCLTGAAYNPSSSDLIHPKGLPVIGKWMISSSNAPANWLGIKFQGKEMREPINLVIIDSSSKTSAEAIARISQYCDTAGYKNRKGHSSGYSAYIGRSLYSQIPSEKDHAFSNRPYELDNDHGRIFGPYKVGGKFYFVGSFSREVVGRVGLKMIHKYGSFRQAREDFADQVTRKTELIITQYIFLDNRISSGTLTTGDHDGFAIVLEN